MAQVIDELLVRVKLQSAQFNKDLDRLNGRLKVVGTTTDKLKSSFSSIGRIAAAAFSVTSISSILSMGKGLDIMAKATGSSANEISAWSNAVEVAGGSSEAFRETFKSISRLTPDVTNHLERLSGVMSGLSERNAFRLGEQLGIDQGTIEFLRKGPDQVRKLVEAQKAGAAVTNDQARASANLSSELTKTLQDISAIGREIVLDFAPAITTVLKLIRSITAAIKESSLAIQLLGSGIVGLINPIAGIALAASSLVPKFNEMGGLSGVLKAGADKFRGTVFGRSKTAEGATKVPAGMGAGIVTEGVSDGPLSKSNTTTVNNTFGDINVSTQSTNPDSLARDILSELDYALVANSMSAMQ